MARVNLKETLGEADDEPPATWQPHLDAIAAEAEPVRIDGKLDCHEFLTLPQGRIAKIDALDHHAAHDLIGCQDIFLDAAGATIEWTLSHAETEFICDQIDRACSFTRPREVLGFYLIAYTVFRLGAATMSFEALNDVDPGEARRFQRRVQFYRDTARALLGKVVTHA